MNLKKSPEFYASKWLHTQFLVEKEELEALFSELGDIVLFSSMGVSPVGENRLTKEKFLEQYETYISQVKAGQDPRDDEFRFAFTSIWSCSEKAVQAIQCPNNREMIRALFPVLQVQLHRFDISPMDGEIRPLVFGKGTISWGLQVSYPQLFQDPETEEVVQVLKEARFENNELFRKFQSWIRTATQPTPFQIRGKKVHSPIRIGKKCLSWVKLNYD